MGLNGKVGLYLAFSLSIVDALVVWYLVWILLSFMDSQRMLCQMSIVFPTCLLLLVNRWATHPLYLINLLLLIWMYENNGGGGMGGLAV